ncbi:hypothetical protein FACS1894170_07430 [Planctomycetales bacterium]|nr:hypothetical protein FACS1894170_07430 [Planctomycetales bacterium]
MTDSIFTRNWNEAAEEDTNYTRLSVLAFIACLFGILSMLVFISVWFAFIGVIGIILAAAALLTIRHADGALSGQGAAYTGLLLPVLCFMAVTIFWSGYYWMLNYQSDKLFRSFFVAALNNDVPTMKNYLLMPYSRSKLDDAAWWKEQYAAHSLHASVHKFVENKLARTLAALGTDKAKVTYYRTQSIVLEDDRESVVKYYAVTYSGTSSLPETFFVKISAVRQYDKRNRQYGWYLSGFPEFVFPEGHIQ